MFRRHSNSNADPGLAGDRGGGLGHRFDPVEVGLAVLGVVALVLIALFKVFWLAPPTVGQAEPPAVEATAAVGQAPGESGQAAGLRLRDVPHLLAPAITSILAPAVDWLAAEFDDAMEPAAMAEREAPGTNADHLPPMLLEWRMFDPFSGAGGIGATGVSASTSPNPLLSFVNVAACDDDDASEFRFICIAPTPG